MSTLSQFFAGGTSFANELVFTSSRTFVTPVKGTYLLTAIGGGGSGGGGNAKSVSTGYYYSGAGGGAGGFCQSLLKLNAGVTLTLVVGAGAAGVASGNNDGLSGGYSSISGAGFTTLTANGGQGGQGGWRSASTRAGGAGGSADGGNLLNVTGQSGSNSTGANQQTSGAGGSVGLFGYTPSGVEGALDGSVYLATSALLGIDGGATYSQIVQPYFGRYLDPKGQIQGYVGIGSSQFLRRFGRAYQDGYPSGNVSANTSSGEFSGGTATSGNPSGHTDCDGGGGGGGGSGAGYYNSSGTYHTVYSGAGGAGRCVVEWAPNA